MLYLKVNERMELPKILPTIGETVIWIARLGGYLARNNDGSPGMIVFWRGLKRLNDLTIGWDMANQLGNCG